MPRLPIPTQTDAVVQSQATGAVDFLKFTGSTLTGSNLIDYGVGPAWKVVGEGDFNFEGHPDLVVQNQATGFVDFLELDADAHLIASAMSNVALPHIVGEGNFGWIAGQAGETFVSQLANGQLDPLALDDNAQLIDSDLVANSVGLPQAVGVGGGPTRFRPVFGGERQRRRRRQYPVGGWVDRHHRV